jgi:hypothetical protein
MVERAMNQTPLEPAPGVGELDPDGPVLTRPDLLDPNVEGQQVLERH